MNGQDLTVQIMDLSRRLEMCLGEFGRWGKDKAKAEYDYRVSQSQEMLKMREQGVPVTILSDIVKGNATVAKKRLNRDIADTMYEAAKENINAIKLQIRVLQDQISREWNSQ